VPAVQVQRDHERHKVGVVTQVRTGFRLDIRATTGEVAVTAVDDAAVAVQPDRLTQTVLADVLG
jgi:hypothetical protein